MSRSLYLLVSFLVGSVYALGQQTVCLGNDASACVGDPITIETCGSGGGINSSIFTLSNPASYNLGDDDFTGVINLGFNFRFYGAVYNQIIVSDNGTISFNVAQAGGYASWSVTNIPTTTATMQNSIMSVWQDLYQPQGGNIYFEVIGAAPNRIAVVFWDGLSMFSSSCHAPNLCFTGAVLLYEGTDVIETHISNKTTCMAWGSGRATHGLNKNGSIAHPVPGRNNQVFDLQNDGYRFTPTGPDNYTLTPIPFAIVTTANNNNIVWHNTNGDSYPYNNGELNTTAQTGEVGYFIASSTCGTGVGAVSDTTFITGLTSSVTASAQDDVCSAGMGSVTATPTSGVSPYTYDWPGLGATTQTVNNVSAGTYTVNMTDGNGCVSSTNVTVGDTPANYDSSVTPVSCPGGSDGTATAAMVPEIGNVTYQWNDANNQTTATATGLPAGTYECVITSDIGCSNTVVVAISEIPAMQLNVVNQVDVTCNSGNDGIVTVEITDGTAPYTYSWTGSNSTSATADDLAVGTTTLTVTDDNGCVITEDFVINEPPALSVGSMSQDTIICIADSVRLFANGAGGSSAYFYEWTLNGQVVGNGSEVYVTPTASSTEYCVTITEQCGSPAATGCVKVDYPAEVDPTLSPDKTGECFPIEVNFDNTTNTTETISYTVWSYSDGEQDTVPGSNSATHEFGVGVYDVEMEVVTNRGCRYFKSYPNLIEGYPFPEPNFYVNPNPASIFEPTVDAFSQSSNDIVSYEWIAEGAEPSYSSLQNPTFTYPAEIENHPLILVVENAYGCSDTLQKLVRIQNEVLLFAPNSFTPDANGFNDKWRVHISGVDVYNFHLEVFNRWGEKVFESFDPEGYWDGTYGDNIVRDGSYIWTITALDYENDNKYEFKGVVNVLK
ncbi:gliding motility-associated C-terminal domain-containing protein [Brumimicrobium sp.]|uniref:T9SS type B sorting domain-containing protein n=1 Tax=Brumimicrobium sp. TaxID=2029867 RepID=UPI003A928F65